ncbi:MAG: [LysW]-lysine hydrolase [Candidatus Bipolaricaulota bacterium]|nr:[LysW]-lysine hydrolase [Candidatus Bipolaricaulota bacterium]
MELLKKMLELYSPAHCEEQLAEFLRDELRRWGFDTELDDVGNLIARIGHGPRKVFLVGHMDTVSGEIPVRVEDGKLYGRGAVDAKGSLAVFIESARLFKESRALTVWVIGCVAEECCSEGARHLLEQPYRPDCVVIGEPSGWESVTLGYRGSVSVLYELKCPPAHHGHATPTVGEEAFRFYQALKSRYPAGKNAFESVDVRLIEIRTYDRGLEDLVEMTLDLRTPLGFDLVELKSFIATIAPDANVVLGDPTPAFRADKNNALVRAFLKAIRAAGGEPSFKLKTGTSDMNVLGPAWGVPIVAYGPGDSALDHTPNEHLSLDEYQRAQQVLTAVLQELSTAALQQIQQEGREHAR